MAQALLGVRAMNISRLWDVVVVAALATGPGAGGCAVAAFEDDEPSCEDGACDWFSSYERTSRADVQSVIDRAEQASITPEMRLAQFASAEAVFAPGAVSFIGQDHQELFTYGFDSGLIQRICLFPVWDDDGWCRAVGQSSDLSRMSAGWLFINSWTTSRGWRAGQSYDVLVEMDAPSEVTLAVSLRPELISVPRAELDELLQAATELQPDLTNNKWEFETDRRADGYRFSIDFQQSTLIATWNRWSSHQLMTICLLPESGDATCQVGGGNVVEGATLVMHSGNNPFLTTYSPGRYEVLVTSEPNFRARAPSEIGSIREFWCHVAEL
jgi:hypothetical protein